MSDALREAVVKQLTVLPGIIENRLRVVVAAKVNVMRLKVQLQEELDNHLLYGTIDGKNAETREAQLRDRTKSYRGALMQAEEELSYASRDLEAAQVDFAAARALSRMLAGGGE